MYTYIPFHVTVSSSLGKFCVPIRRRHFNITIINMQQCVTQLKNIAHLGQFLPQKMQRKVSHFRPLKLSQGVRCNLFILVRR